MATIYDSEDFVSTPLEGQGARRKDSYLLASEQDEAKFQAADSEYRRLKADLQESHAVDDSAVTQDYSNMLKSQ